jgi:protein-disulfide isomerase-like protein with CxxC motif
MQSGGAAQVQRVLDQRSLPWATVVDESGDLARRLGVQSVPALMVLDAQGHLRAASVGYTSEIGMRLRLWWARALGRAPA